MTKSKVLIVSDESKSRESLKLLLSDFYDLILTDNIEQGINILSNSKDLGLVIWDLKKPDDLNTEALQLIKEHAPDIKFLQVVLDPGIG